ncbi:MAG: ferredoxin family protein [Candidatus Omnitrophota bacterium]
MPKITIDRERCKGCQLCVIYCPKGLIKPESRLNKKGIQPVMFLEGAAAKRRGAASGSNCTGCKFCALICPDGAVEVYR